MYVKIRFADDSLMKDVSKENPPCKNAELRTHVITERFPLTGDDEIDVLLRKKWKSGGANHREQDSILFRDISTKDWYFLWMTTGPVRELVDKFGGIYLRRTVEDNELWEMIVGPEVKFSTKKPGM